MARPDREGKERRTRCYTDVCVLGCSRADEAIGKELFFFFFFHHLHRLIHNNCIWWVSVTCISLMLWKLFSWKWLECRNCVPETAAAGRAAVKDQCQESIELSRRNANYEGLERKEGMVGIAVWFCGEVRFAKVCAAGAWSRSVSQSADRSLCVRGVEFRVRTWVLNTVTHVSPALWFCKCEFFTKPAYHHRLCTTNLT